MTDENNTTYEATPGLNNSLRDTKAPKMPTNQQENNKPICGENGDRIKSAPESGKLSA